LMEETEDIQVNGIETSVALELSKQPKDLRTQKQIAEYVDALKMRILGGEPNPIPYESLESFYEELVAYYRTLSLDELTPYLDASYTLLTHQTPNLTFTFDLYISGLKGSGKSTHGERLEAICYQAFKVTACTFPFLIRINEVLNGATLILDEYDLVASDDRVSKFLRGSTDRRNPYGLVEQVNFGGVSVNLPAVKNSFGPRILITAMPLKDEMVRDRCIEITMMQCAGILPDPDPEIVDELKEHLAHYRETVKLTITPEDKAKWYDPKRNSGRLNEIACLLYKVTPEKYHDKIKQIIEREWQLRTQLERESYAAKVIESMTAAVLSDDTREAANGEVFVPDVEIKRHYDLRYADPQTGKGKTKVPSIGHALHNLGLHTKQFRVKDEERRLRGWPLDKARLAQIRASLYLDDMPDLVSSVSIDSSPTAHPLSETASLEEEPVHTLGSETNETNETKPAFAALTDNMARPDSKNSQGASKGQLGSDE
jgi:hypothetical protein